MRAPVTGSRYSRSDWFDGEAWDGPGTRATRASATARETAMGRVGRRRMVLPRNGFSAAALMVGARAAGSAWSIAQPAAWSRMPPPQPRRGLERHSGGGDLRPRPRAPGPLRRRRPDGRRLLREPPVLVRARA